MAIHEFAIMSEEEYYSEIDFDIQYPRDETILKDSDHIEHLNRMNEHSELKQYEDFLEDLVTKYKG